MNDWIFQTVLPFLFSALVVIGVTILAERFGTKVGGIFGTLPSTIVIAFVFIALNQGMQFASDAVVVVPAEMGINLWFLLVFSMLAGSGGLIALVGAFVWWFAGSVLLYYFGSPSIWVSVVVFVVALVIALWVLEHRRKVKSVQGKKVRYTPGKIAFRGLIAGTVVMTAVLLSNINETISGLFSVFPAVFLSTMIISIRDHGEEFVSGMAKSMIFGSFSVVAYAVALHFLYPILDIFWGTIVCFVLSFCVALVLYGVRDVLS